MKPDHTCDLVQDLLPLWLDHTARIPKLSSNSIFPTAPPAGEFWRIWMRRLLCRRSRMPHRCVL